jgi:hypothetical protein
MLRIILELKGVERRYVLVKGGKKGEADEQLADLLRPPPFALTRL